MNLDISKRGSFKKMIEITKDKIHYWDPFKKVISRKLVSYY